MNRFRTRHVCVSISNVLHPQREIARLVVPLVLGDATVAQEAAAILSAKNLWRDALGLAQDWHVLPLVRRRLAELRIKLNDDIEHDLRTTLVAFTAQSTLIAKRGALALDRLYRSGIGAAGFKGMGVIGNLYAGPSERMLSDVDLLVVESDVPSACDVLGQLGYKSLLPVSLSQWKEYLETQPDQSTAFVLLISGEGIQLDLHWRLRTTGAEVVSAADVIERAVRVPLFGLQVPVVAPLDAMTLTTFHAWRQRFAPGTTVKDLCDVQLWLEKHGEDCFLEELREHFHQSEMAVPLLGLLSLLSHYNPRSRARRGYDVLAKALAAAQRRAAERAPHLFSIQLERGALNRDVFALFNPMGSLAHAIGRLRNRKRYAELRNVWRETFDSESLRPTRRWRRLTRELTDLNKLSLYLDIWRNGMWGHRL